MTYKLTDLLSDWLTDLTDSLTDKIAKWLLTVRVINWLLFDWPTNLLADLLTEWLTILLAEWQNNCSDGLYDQLADHLLTGWVKGQLSWLNVWQAGWSLRPFDRLSDRTTVLTDCMTSWLITCWPANGRTTVWTNCMTIWLITFWLAEWWDNCLDYDKLADDLLANWWKDNCLD